MNTQDAIELLGIAPEDDERELKNREKEKEKLSENIIR